MSQFCVQIKVIYPKQYYKNWETQMTHVLLLFLGRLGCQDNFSKVFYLKIAFSHSSWAKQTQNYGFCRVCTKMLIKSKKSVNLGFKVSKSLAAARAIYSVFIVLTWDV